MTDFGRRLGLGDMSKATYDPNDDGVIALAQTQADMIKAVYDPIVAALQALAAAHKTQHQTGGTDEIDCTGLVGRLNYVDRGDPAAHDFTLATLSTDGDYHDIDFSSIISAGAKVAHLFCGVQDNDAGRYMYFRKKGNVNAAAVSNIQTQGSQIYNYQDMWVTLDENLKAEYQASDTTFTSIVLTVRGWLI